MYVPLKTCASQEKILRTFEPLKTFEILENFLLVSERSRSFCHAPAH